MINLSHSLWNIENNLKHYETGFIPVQATLDEIRNSAFTPTVFRQPTKEEYTIMFAKKYNKLSQTKYKIQDYIDFRIKKSTGGYRAKAYVIGLCDLGYVDIDGIKPDTEGSTPTIDNVADAMEANNLFHLTFQSGSAKEGKIRLIYKRHFMLFLDGAYTKEGGFNLSPTSLTKKWSCTDPSFPKHSTSLPITIKNVLTLETKYIATILAEAGINTSGIDLTACQPHMHSSHCIRPDMTYETPRTNYNGEAL